MNAPGAAPQKKRINLALQGGGAFGAYTWGVLDAFLADGRIDVVAISGTSAGAMNAVVFADGLRRGGPERASNELREFWRDVSLDGGLDETQRSALHAVLGLWQPFGLPAQWMENASSVFAPAQSNPFDFNLLRDIIRRDIDFQALQTSEGPKLFVAATNVWTGKVRVFKRHELTVDMVMASACLPLLFSAVVIDGEPYWDGGYMGNPVLFPFWYGTDCDDVVLVQINPVERRDTPDTSAEIANRMNEITFNAPLLQELRAVQFVSELIDLGRLDGLPYRKVRMHRVNGGADLSALGSKAKLDTEWSFFEDLHERGKAAGERFLAKNFDAIGVRGTLDLKAEVGAAD